MTKPVSYDDIKIRFPHIEGLSVEFRQENAVVDHNGRKHYDLTIDYNLKEPDSLASRVVKVVVVALAFGGVGVLCAHFGGSAWASVGTISTGVVSALVFGAIAANLIQKIHDDHCEEYTTLRQEEINVNAYPQKQEIQKILEENWIATNSQMNDDLSQ